MNRHELRGAGLGLRRELIPSLLADVPPAISFLELAPENWIGVGGRAKRQLRQFTERLPVVCHGLSLSLGGTAPLDVTLLQAIRAFMAEHGLALYTEHLSWCGDAHRLYDLLPLPFTDEAVRWTAARIRQSQDILGQRIGIENASAYLMHPGAAMTEGEFISAVVAEADCLLHLDVNNLYVNSRNFNLSPLCLLDSLPLDKTCYIHVAGHHVEPDGLVIDTHGAPVIDPVWALLGEVYRRIGPLPTCLERDTEIPALDELMPEVEQIESMQRQSGISQRREAA